MFEEGVADQGPLLTAGASRKVQGLYSFGNACYVRATHVRVRLSRTHARAREPLGLVSPAQAAEDRNV